tara:strand:+ start:2896 stop:3174 length:279 start_codon:yes stop_codon:yes gene_type:complete
MKFITMAMWKNYTKEEKRKINQNLNQMGYADKNKEYYANYQKNHYLKNKKHRCRTMKALYYKKTYNKEIFFIKPPLNYEEYMKKLNLKIKYC